MIQGNVENRILTAAIKTYGNDAQKKMALEEMSELQKEICKNWRGKDNYAEIAEEIADVEIMLDQLKMIFGISERQLSKFRNEKVMRLKERLENVGVSCI